MHFQIINIDASIVDAGVAPGERRSHEALLDIRGIISPYVLLICLRVKLFIRVVLHVSDTILIVLFEAQGGATCLD